MHVAAPRDQFSGAGRSLPSNSDGTIQIREVVVNGKPWQVHAVGVTPAQAVQHAVLEILGRPPDLLVSGINYGENVGSGVTISGTVGAALEGSALGIPSLAISLETETHHHFSLSTEVDFSTAAYFTAYFGQINGLVFIGHGRSDAFAIKNAIRVAKEAVESGVLDSIRIGIEQSLKSNNQNRQ